MKYYLDEKMAKERSKYKIYCECGHSIIIYPFEHKNKKLCSHCGKYVYKNKEEEFKERLGILL